MSFGKPCGTVRLNDGCHHDLVRRSKIAFSKSDCTMNTNNEEQEPELMMPRDRDALTGNAVDVGMEQCGSASNPLASVRHCG